MGRTVGISGPRCHKRYTGASQTGIKPGMRRELDRAGPPAIEKTCSIFWQAANSMDGWKDYGGFVVAARIAKKGAIQTFPEAG